MANILKAKLVDDNEGVRVFEVDDDGRKALFKFALPPGPVRIGQEGFIEIEELPNEPITAPATDGGPTEGEEGADASTPESTPSPSENPED